MTGFIRRTRALSFAVLGLLLTPAAANAAMGGANALTTTQRPDLRSATVQSTNTVDDTTTVRACFNKDIANNPQAAPSVSAPTRTTTTVTRSPR